MFIIPKLSVQAIGNSRCCFSSTISFVKIFLNSLQKGNWDLSASGFNCNHAVGCCVQHKTQELTQHRKLVIMNKQTTYSMQLNQNDMFASDKSHKLGRFENKRKEMVQCDPWHPSFKL
jgi:hypothetical protein